MVDYSLTPASVAVAVALKTTSSWMGWLGGSVSMGATLISFPGIWNVRATVSLGVPLSVAITVRLIVSGPLRFGGRPGDNSGAGGNGGSQRRVGERIGQRLRR